jgi:Protein phosphatase 2C
VTVPKVGALPAASPVSPRGIPAIGDPGRAARELAAGEPPEQISLPDHILSEYATRDLDIRAASVRGLMHRYRSQPRQDTFSVVHEAASETTVVVVCDGVGSLPRSHEAAAYVAEALPARYLKHRDWVSAALEVNASLQVIADEARIDRTDGTEGSSRELCMATTVVAVAIQKMGDRRSARILRNDDSTVWHLSASGWVSVSRPEPTSDDLHSGSVQGLPAESPRLHTQDLPFDEGALFIMTDGVGLPLATSVQVRDTLAQWWSTPPTIFQFGQQVGFARKSHMDDRTVVGLWLKHSLDDAT